MVRILINGVEPVNKPIGLDAIAEKWEFDKTVKIYYVEITGNLQFFGVDFNYFFDIFQNNRCEFVTIEIQKKNGDNGNWYEVFNGNIIVSDIDFDFDRRIASCEIIDNSFIARIYNNNDAQVNLELETTLRGEAITMPVNLINVKSTDNVEVVDVPAFTLYDSLNYVVKWITDNKVTVESDYLTTDAEALTFYLCTGDGLRLQQSSSSQYPVISFTELWTDLHKLFHLYGFFYKTTTGWIFKVEPYSYFESFSGLHEFDQLKNVIATSRREEFKNRIIFGSKINEKETANVDNPIDPALTWYIDGFNYYFNGWWNKDEIVIPSDCTILNTLDLKMSRLVSDINTISASFRDNSKGDLATEIMIVQPTSEWKHIPLSPWDVSTFTPYPLRGYFNEPIMNANVLKRWLDEICITGDLSSIKKCELSAITTADQLNFTLGFDDSTVPCSGYNLSYFFEKLARQPDLFDFEFYYIFENTTGGAITVFLEGVGYPSDNTFIAHPAYYNITQWQTPQSTGWTPVIPIGPAQDGLSNQVSQTIPPGNTVIYHGFTYDVLMYPNLAFYIIFAVTNGATLKAGSYIKVRPKLNKILDSNINCNAYNTEISAEGFILDSDINQFRQETFKSVLIPNSFKNVSGKVVSLERNILNGTSNIVLKSKTV